LAALNTAFLAPLDAAFFDELLSDGHGVGEK
jgi:hypothetical protein